LEVLGKLHTLKLPPAKIPLALKWLLEHAIGGCKALHDIVVAVGHGDPAGYDVVVGYFCCVREGIVPGGVGDEAKAGCCAAKER